LIRREIKCFRFPCEACGNNKIATSIQVFFRKNGEVSYARARHQGADKKFYYHQQSIEYVKEKLRELSNIDHGQDSKGKSIDQTRTKSSSILDLEPSAGFGPATITLPR
jgi:hypothetical protein